MLFLILLFLLPRPTIYQLNVTLQFCLEVLPSVLFMILSVPSIMQISNFVCLDLKVFPREGRGAVSISPVQITARLGAKDYLVHMIFARSILISASDSVTNKTRPNDASSSNIRDFSLFDDDNPQGRTD